MNSTGKQKCTYMNINHRSVQKNTSHIQNTFLFTHTHFAAGAAYSHSILLCWLNSSVGTSTAVLCKAQVVVRAHVDDVLHHFARVPERDGEHHTDNWLTEIIMFNMCACLPWSPGNNFLHNAIHELPQLSCTEIMYNSLLSQGNLVYIVHITL